MNRERVGKERRKGEKERGRERGREGGEGEKERGREGGRKGGEGGKERGVEQEDKTLTTRDDERYEEQRNTEQKDNWNLCLKKTCTRSSCISCMCK